MNALKKILAWVRSDPQQEELDARREHFELQSIKAREGVKLLESIGAKWLPFSSCAYAWRIGGVDWPTSKDVVSLPLHTMTTWPEDQKEVAALFSLGLMGYRWRSAYQRWEDRNDPVVVKSYVDAYYEVAELLQVEKADFKPLNLSVPEVVKAHILSLLAVETAYLKLIDKNSRRKQNVNELYGKLSPNIKISSQGVAVDQAYFWNYDMDKCPQGKVQLLGKGGIPAYGYKAQGGDFWQAWAPLPKTRK